MTKKNEKNFFECLRIWNFESFWKVKTVSCSSVSSWFIVVILVSPPPPPPLHSECFQGFLHFILCLDWVPLRLISPLPSVNLGQIPTTPITPLFTHTVFAWIVHYVECCESVKLSSTNSALAQIFQPHSEAAAPVLFWFVFSSKWWTRS